MVSRDSAVRKKKKQPGTEKLGKAALKNLNIRSYGGEPTFTKPLTDHDASVAFNWYSLNVKHKDAKQFLVYHLSQIDDPIADEIAKVPSTTVLGFGGKACWVARMLQRGAVFLNEDTEDLVGPIEKILDKVKELAEKKEKLKVEPPTIRPRHPQAYQKLEEHLSVLCEADDAVNITKPKKTDLTFDLYEWLGANKVHKNYIHDYIEHFEGLLKEIELYLSGDPEMVQSYERVGYTSQDAQRKRILINRIILDARTYYSDVGLPAKDKATRAPADRPSRKPKVLSPDKIVSRMQYLKEDPELKLKSIDPKKILGAAELWVYNTKYGLLQVYRANDPNGLSVKGTTLLNYDEEASVGKRCGRTADKQTQAVLTSGKPALKKVMDNISSARVAVNGRINENSILLRVIA